MPDPYQTLGVAKTATADEIKSAYRKLAKKLHPDVNPGKKEIEHKFKEVTAAYDLLSDKDKRARFDRVEIDGMGNERAFSGAAGDPFRGGAAVTGAARRNPEAILSANSAESMIFSRNSWAAHAAGGATAAGAMSAVRTLHIHSASLSLKHALAESGELHSRAARQSM